MKSIMVCVDCEYTKAWHTNDCLAPGRAEKPQYKHVTTLDELRMLPEYREYYNYEPYRYKKPIYKCCEKCGK